MDPAAQTGHYEVRVETPMFRYGPAQSFGPDFTLKQGQHVVLMRRDFGYSRIMTDEGQTGYVATEDIIPTSAPKVAAAGRSSGSGAINYPGLPPQWQGRVVRGSDARGGRFSGPVLPAGELFGPGDRELPPLPGSENSAKPDAPKVEFRHPKPKPTFRVNIPTPDAGTGGTAPATPETPVPAFR